MRGMQQQLGNLGTISAFACRHRETKKNLCRGGRSQELPDTDFQPAVRHLKQETFHTEVVEEKETHFMLNFFFPQKSCRYEIMWKNMVDQDRPHMAVRHMRSPYWMVTRMRLHITLFVQQAYTVCLVRLEVAPIIDVTCHGWRASHSDAFQGIS